MLLCVVCVVGLVFTYILNGHTKHSNTLAARPRILVKTHLCELCDISIARATGCVFPHEGYAEVGVVSAARCVMWCVLCVLCVLYFFRCVNPPGGVRQ